MIRPRPSAAVRAAGLSVGLILAGAPLAQAHSPDPGGVVLHPASDPVLEWKFVATYPAWLTAGVEAGLNDTATHDASWDSDTFNNSKIQNFTKLSTGTGRIQYSAGDPDGTSPCSSSADWIQCADPDLNNDGTTTDWKIWIRNVDLDPLSYGGVPARWADDGSSSSLVTFDVQRNVLHEAIHVTMGVFNHYTDRDWGITLMTKYSPDDNDQDWAVRRLQECDQARAQLLFGMATSMGKVGQCFDHGYTASGLVTVLTLADPADTCLGDNVPISGTLRTATSSPGYGLLSNVPLGGRTVTVKRNGVTVATLATTSTGTFSGSAVATSTSNTFVASWSGEGPYALASATSPSVVVGTFPSPPC